MKLSDEKIQELMRVQSRQVKEVFEELLIRRQLQEYVRHYNNCAMENPNSIFIGEGNFNECTCGLSDILSKLKELEGV